MRLNLSLIVLLAAILNGLTSRGAGDAPPAAADPQLGTDTHLVGWWKFDESSGVRANDASGQGHPATLESGLSFEDASVPGRVGRAVRLDGKQQVIRVPGFKGVSGPKPRTIAVWIRTSATAGEVVSWGSNDHGQMWTFGFIREHLGVTPKGGYYYMKAGVQDGKWHHVAAVVQEASPPNLHDHVQLFKDGVLAEIDDIGLLDLWPIETGDKLDVAIGRRFQGSIDDLRIYDRALSEDEIAVLAKVDQASSQAAVQQKGTAP
jgi:hypothetical protein